MTSNEVNDMPYALALSQTRSGQQAQQPNHLTEGYKEGSVSLFHLHSSSSFSAQYGIYTKEVEVHKFSPRIFKETRFTPI